MAYCDNLNAGVFSRKQAGELRDDVQKDMEQDGFTIHEISGPPLFARVLGSVLNGGAGTLSPDPDKLWKLIVTG
eukprot:893845-Pyramimonas_sp.AAC.1